MSVDGSLKKEIDKEELDEGKVLSVSDLPAGVYLLKIWKTFR